jgi:hypothetical protein
MHDYSEIIQLSERDYTNNNCMEITVTSVVWTQDQDKAGYFIFDAMDTHSLVSMGFYSLCGRCQVPQSDMYAGEGSTTCEAQIMWNIFQGAIYKGSPHPSPLLLVQPDRKIVDAALVHHSRFLRHLVRWNWNIHPQANNNHKIRHVQGVEIDKRRGYKHRKGSP